MEGDRYAMCILNAVRQIARAADINSRRLAARYQVTAPQLLSLMALVDRGESSAKEIAEQVHVGQSTLVGILDRLEAKGFIARHRNVADRREVAVVATAAGGALVATAPFPLQQELGQATGALSAREREQLAGWMERLVALMNVGEVEQGREPKSRPRDAPGGAERR